MLLLMHPFFSFHLQRRSTKLGICRLTFTTVSSISNILIFQFFSNSDFLFRYFINLITGEAVLSIIAQASGFTKLNFMEWKTRNRMSSPNPEHENSRFWLCRNKFVIYEAVLNIIVQATTFARVFFLHKGLKNKRAIGNRKIKFFWTTLISTVVFLRGMMQETFRSI